jgi:hypothetical protein
VDYNALIKRSQSIIYAIRRGQTTQALAILVPVLIGAGEYIRREWKEPDWALYIVYAAYGLAGMCFLWLVWRLWKVAATPPEPKGEATPSAIKGLLPWGYMGWIRKHRAGAGEKVRGIIITGAPDERIKYALFASEGIEFFTYKVSFDLVAVEKVE